MWSHYNSIQCAVLIGAVFFAGPAQAMVVHGDIDGDGFVGAPDVQIVLNHWATTVTPGDLSRGDVIPDGFIDIKDLSFVLTYWGQGTAPRPRGNTDVGINLSAVSYFTREWVFVDAMKIAKSWTSTKPGGVPFDTGKTVRTDANGWPILHAGESAQTLLFNGNGGFYPEGQYVCTFDGDGVIAFQFDAQNVQLTSPSRMTFDIPNATNAGVLMRIVSSDPANPVKNIKVWMPGFEGATNPFHPIFLQKLQPFGVIRFMDWQHTNGTQRVTWDQRTTVNSASQGHDYGVALGYMIQLCNRLGADPWFCMPHTADDNFVREFAKQVKAELNPDRKVYIEWSNEVWNTSFGQNKWVTQHTSAPVLSASWFQKWADEAANDFAIWHQVFAGEENRIIRVAAGQAANVWVTRNLTDKLNGQYDAIAIAAYFDQGGASFNARTTADDILDNALNVTIPNVQSKLYQNHGDLARQRTGELGRTIPFISYEGGQHYTVSGNTGLPYYKQFLEIQTHPKMYDAYRANLKAFDQAGGSLFVAFNFVRRQDKWGSWGHLQYQNQSGTKAVSPKYRALLDFAGY